MTVLEQFWPQVETAPSARGALLRGICYALLLVTPFWVTAGAAVWWWIVRS